MLGVGLTQMLASDKLIWSPGLVLYSQIKVPLLCSRKFAVQCSWHPWHKLAGSHLRWNRYSGQPSGKTERNWVIGDIVRMLDQSISEPVWQLDSMFPWATTLYCWNLNTTLLTPYYNAQIALLARWIIVMESNLPDKHRNICITF